MARLGTPANLGRNPKAGGAGNASAPRNIVLFADGTGNSSTSSAKSNVWRLYQAVESGPPLAGQPEQIVHYIDGVGTSSFRWLALIGQALGFGLARKVKALYEFLCRHYRPGDHIYVFGFSRGAFTARVLVDLIASCGILDLGRPAPHKPQLIMAQEEGFRLGILEAYRSYRHKYWRAASSHLNLANAIWERIGAVQRWLRNDKQPFQSPEEFMKDYCHKPIDNDERRAIRCIGVWDTVDAYGVPVRELASLIDRTFYPYQFTDRKLNPMIARAFQALSLDDKRETFHPLLWDERLVAASGLLPGGRSIRGTINTVADWIRPGTIHDDAPVIEKSMHSRNMVGAVGAGLPGIDTRIRQVWFPGMHADVGGGYPEPGLAMVSLDWMAREVVQGSANSGGTICFKPDHLAEFEKSRQATAQLHDSRAGAAAVFRYRPRDVGELCGHGQSNPPLFVKVPKIHCSVFDRLRDEQVGYAPSGMPGDHAIVEWNCTVSPTREPNQLRAMRMAIQARTRNHIFWRVVTYFGMLFPIIVLLLLPLFRFLFSARFNDWFFSSPNMATAGLNALTGYLTAFPVNLANHFVLAWAEAPHIFVAMLALGAGCYFWSGWYIQRNVQGFAEAALFWFRGQAAPPALRAPQRFERLAGWLTSQVDLPKLLRNLAGTIEAIAMIALVAGAIYGAKAGVEYVSPLVFPNLKLTLFALVDPFMNRAAWALLALALIFSFFGVMSRR